MTKFERYGLVFAPAFALGVALGVWTFREARPVETCVPASIVIQDGDALIVIPDQQVCGAGLHVQDWANQGAPRFPNANGATSEATAPVGGSAPLVFP